MISSDPCHWYASWRRSELSDQPHQGAFMRLTTCKCDNSHDKKRPSRKALWRPGGKSYGTTEQGFAQLRG